VADFPHAGDLMVMSTVYPDGTVAAMEELIGSHGGLGGGQTDAFLFHPGDMEVPPTQNSVDLYHILNARRGTPVPEQPQADTRVEASDVWTLAALWAGIRQVRTWARYLLGAFVLQRATYASVARDVTVTGPALLIAFVCAFLATIDQPGPWQPEHAVVNFMIWLLGVILITTAARALGGRYSMTRSMRALGFAHSVSVLNLIARVAVLAPAINGLTLILSFIAYWLAATEAQELRGWRSLLLPIVGFLLPVAALTVLAVLAEGAAFTIQSLMQQVGLAN